MRKLLLGSLIVLLVAGLVLIGCAKQTETPKPAPTSSPATTKPSQTATTATTAPAIKTPSPKYGGVLTMVQDAPSRTAFGYPPDYSGGVTNFGQAIVESLLRADYKGNVYPWLAESYKVADDLKSITLKLRKGVKFHDGSELNAQAVKWNLENQIAAKKAPYYSSVEVVDDYTIRINVTEWRNTLLFDLADADAAGGYIVSPTAFQKNGVDWLRQNPVGTGPFKFVSYQPDVGLKTVKNPDYWAKDASGNKLPYLDALNILVIADPMTRLAYMQSGQGDMVHLYSGKDVADYKAAGLTVVAPLNGTIALVPDTANADSPWAKQKVREAVEYAIDREAIAKGLGYGQWIAPYQTPGRDSPLYDPNFTIIRKYDVTKAKQLLAEAGYPNGFKTTILCFAGGLNRDAANTLQAYLIKAGIQAELEIPELGKIMTVSMSGWQNEALLWPVLTYGNFNTGMNNFNPTAPNFKSWLRTPEFTQAFKASLSSPTVDVKLARAFISIFAKDASVIPVYETGGGSGFKPYVKNGGWGERGMESFINYEQIWLDK